MKKIFLKFTALSVLILLPLCLFSQKIDLIKLKKQEEERRKNLKKANKKSIKITESVLKGYRLDQKKHSAAGTRMTRPLKKPSSNKIKEKKDDKAAVKVKEDEKKKQEYWQRKARDIRTQIAKTQPLIAQKKNEIDKLTHQYLLMSDFYKRSALNEKIKEAKATKSDLEKSLAKHQTKLDELHKEARANYIPPGWLR